MNGDNNKLIAEFMGMKYSDERSFNDGEWTHSIRSLSKFHTSWDWLMPVIRRIRDHVNIDMSFEEYDDWRENFKEIDPYNYSLEQCYTAVVEFINEYNKNN